MTKESKENVKALYKGMEMSIDGLKQDKSTWAGFVEECFKSLKGYILFLELETGHKISQPRERTEPFDVLDLIETIQKKKESAGLTASQKEDCSLEEIKEVVFKIIEQRDVAEEALNLVLGIGTDTREKLKERYVKDAQEKINKRKESSN